MEPKKMLPHEHMLTKMKGFKISRIIPKHKLTKIQGFLEKGVAKKEPTSILSQEPTSILSQEPTPILSQEPTSTLFTEPTSTPLVSGDMSTLALSFILVLVFCMVLVYQINKRGIKDRVLDEFIFKMRSVISYLESLSNTYGQEGYGAKRKTDKEVQTDLEVASSAFPSYRFWRTREYYCFHVKNNNPQDAIIVLSQTAIELTKEVVTSEGTLGVKAGGADIANATTSISAYTISAFQADETVLVQNKNFNLTTLLPVPDAKKGSGLYFCPQQNALFNAKYWNYKIPKMDVYNETQPVVKYDGFSIVPHLPTNVPTSIDDALSAEVLSLQLDDSSITSFNSSIISQQSF
jgi:hypothetical protein